MDASAVAGGDGTSWTDAFTDLQDALAVAADGDTIHVARGTYVPCCRLSPLVPLMCTESSTKAITSSATS